jgi:hypothetical protein
MRANAPPLKATSHVVVVSVLTVLVGSLVLFWVAVVEELSEAGASEVLLSVESLVLLLPLALPLRA